MTESSIQWLEEINREHAERLLCLDCSSPSDIGDIILWCSKHGVRVILPNSNEIEMDGKIIHNYRRNLMILSARDNDIQPTSESNLCQKH